MASRLRALALSTHPGPGIAVTVVAVLLGVGVQLAPWRVALLGLAVLANQVSVGLSNDWLDAERDRAVGRTDKPVALGLVSIRLVRASAIASAALGIVLTVPLGIWAALAQTVFIGAAWAYNAGLKNTPISVLPYIIGFGLLPSIVTLSRPDPVLAAPWAFGLGAMLGVAAHVANVLPDLDDDARTGIAGLPHRIGRRASGVVLGGALVLGALFAFFGPARATTPLQWAGLISTLLLALAIGVLLTRPPTRLLFQLIIAAALVNVVLLVFSGDRLLG